MKQFYIKFLLLNLFSIFLVCPLAFGMKEDKLSLFQPKSLVYLSKIASIRKCLKMEPDEIKADLDRLPEELRESIAERINEPFGTFGQTMIHQPATLQSIDRLLALRADPNASNALGDTPLTWYLKQNQPQNAIRLLKSGASVAVNHKNIYGVGVFDLMSSLKNKKYNNELEDLLLECGAKRNMVIATSSYFSRYSESLLGLVSSSTKSKSEEKLERIFDTFMGFSDFEDSLIYLHQLSDFDKKALTEYVNKPITKNGMRHLHYAKTAFEVQKLLLLKARRDTKTETEESPLHSMMQRGYISAAHALLDSAASSEYCNQPDAYHMVPLCYAVLLGNRSLVKKLLSKQADRNYACTVGNDIISPGHCLLSSTNKKMVSEILTPRFVRGMDNEVRFDLMSQALKNDRSDIFQALVPNGLELDIIRNVHGFNLNFLMYLLKKEKFDCLEKIFSQIWFSDNLHFDIDINAKNNDASTPLMIAARYAPNSLQMLLNAGASVADVDLRGFTVLHYAAETEKIHDASCIALLCSKGANVNAQSNKGNTPLHFAVKVDSPKIVEALIAHGADITIRNNEGLTPYDIAASQFASDCRHLVEL